MNFLKVEHDKAHGLDIKVTFEIPEFNVCELAVMNQCFDDVLWVP